MGQNRFGDDGLTIGELSRRTAVHIETIRYYERIGLLARPPRTPAGHRLFGPESYRTLAFIKRSRELGFGLEDIRTLLSLRNTQAPCKNVRAVAARHLEQVQTKIRDLAKLERVLSKAIAACPNDEHSDCPMLDSLDNGSCQTDTAA
jgi:MerR family mercuric resistance operon transcriptional regulator